MHLRPQNVFSYRKCTFLVLKYQMHNFTHEFKILNYIMTVFIALYLHAANILNVI